MGHCEAADTRVGLRGRPTRAKGEGAKAAPNTNPRSFSRAHIVERRHRIYAISSIRGLRYLHLCASAKKPERPQESRSKSYELAQFQRREERGRLSTLTHESIRLAKDHQT